MTRRLLLAALTVSIAALSASTANADSAVQPKEGVYVDLRSGVVLDYRDHRIDAIGIYGGFTEDAESATFPPGAKVELKDDHWAFSISSQDDPPWGRGHWSDATNVTGRLFLHLRGRRATTRQIDFHAGWVRS